MGASYTSYAGMSCTWSSRPSNECRRSNCTAPLAAGALSGRLGRRVNDGSGEYSRVEGCRRLEPAAAANLSLWPRLEAISVEALAGGCGGAALDAALEAVGIVGLLSSVRALGTGGLGAGGASALNAAPGCGSGATAEGVEVDTVLGKRTGNVELGGDGGAALLRGESEAAASDGVLPDPAT